MAIRTTFRLTGGDPDDFLPFGHPDDSLLVGHRAAFDPVLDDSVPAVSLKPDDIAQVLPGLSEDDFVLSKDADLPLVLPGVDGEIETLAAPAMGLDVWESFPSHMLTLDGDGGFAGGTDDFGRLHDHDGWLF